MRTTTRAVGTSFTHLVFFPCSCCHSSGPSARCGFTVVTDILLYTNIHHPPPFLAHLLSTSLSEPGADPYSISNSAFHSFFFFFLTDTAEYRKCYPHIYSSLDASFSLNLLFTCAGVFIATVGQKAAELPHVCLACLPLALTPPPHHHPSILGEKRS